MTDKQLRDNANKQTNAESIKLAQQAKFLRHIHRKMQIQDRQTTERQCKQASKAIEMQNQSN